MHKLVIDLEMNSSFRVETPWDKQGYRRIREIIEIGGVLLDDNNTPIDKIRIFVKPCYQPISEYIHNLTGINQEQLDNADSIDLAFNKLIEFTGYRSDVILCTWSDSDVIAIRDELEAKRIENKYIENLLSNYIDIQKLFDERTGFERQVSLEDALELVDMTFEGTAHDALNDAINTANLYTSLESDDRVNEIVSKINGLMTSKPITSSIGSKFDFSSYKFD